MPAGSLKGIEGLPPEGPGSDGTMGTEARFVQGTATTLPSTRAADINEKTPVVEDVILSPHVGSTGQKEAD